MFNMKGDVIGIISSILTRSGGFDGISIAISSKTVKNLLLDENPRWTGLDTVMLHKYAAAFNVPQEAGLLVQRVAQGAMADSLGLKGGDKLITIGNRELLIGGDVILEIAGIIVSPATGTLKEIRSKVQEIASGGELSVKVLRAGKLKELTIILE